MKHWLIILLLLIFATAVPAVSQAEAIQTSVCELMHHPDEFEGKVVKLRAQIWTDHDQFWLNESAASSHRFNAFCGWLPANFSHPTSLVGSKAFATFTGRLIRDPGSSWKHLRFLIEAEADIYRSEVMNGLHMVPQLYDQRVRAFVHPEHYPLYARFARYLEVSGPPCYWPSYPEGIASEIRFSLNRTPMICGYVCNRTVPIRVCTKG